VPEQNRWPTPPEGPSFDHLIDQFKALILRDADIDVNASQRRGRRHQIKSTSFDRFQVQGSQFAVAESSSAAN
jgi:hypothetical protein